MYCLQDRHKIDTFLGIRLGSSYANIQQKITQLQVKQKTYVHSNHSNKKFTKNECQSSIIKLKPLLGAAYREMLHNIMSPIVNRPGVTLARYDIHHALPTNTNALIGRAAHIAVLDSELFIEKFLIVAALKYFQ